MFGFSWKREQVYFLRYSNVNSTVWCSWWSCSTRNVGFFSGSWTMTSGFRLQLVEFFVCLPWQTYSSVSCKCHREMQTCTSAAASAVSLILLLVAFRKYTRTTCYGVHILGVHYRLCTQHCTCLYNQPCSYYEMRYYYAWIYATNCRILRWQCYLSAAPAGEIEYLKTKINTTIIIPEQ